MLDPRPAPRRLARIVAVELAEGATALSRLAPADRRTVVLLVAVAGSLVLYRLAGLS